MFIEEKIMLVWRNGLRSGLRNRLPVGSAGSNPAMSTKRMRGGMAYTPVSKADEGDLMQVRLLSHAL